MGSVLCCVSIKNWLCCVSYDRFQLGKYQVSYQCWMCGRHRFTHEQATALQQCQTRHELEQKMTTNGFNTIICNRDACSTRAFMIFNGNMPADIKAIDVLQKTDN